MLRQEIELCLNCDKTSCNYGTCQYFKEKSKNVYIICIRKLKNGTKKKSYFLSIGGNQYVKTAKYEFDAPLFTKKEALKMLKRIKEKTQNIKSNTLWTIEMNV